VNYFNYFTEVEEHFPTGAGTPCSFFLHSIGRWWKRGRNAGVPLEAVLRGIDSAFDKWRQKKTRTQGSQFPGLLCASGHERSRGDG